MTKTDANAWHENIEDLMALYFCALTDHTNDFEATMCSHYREIRSANQDGKGN